MPRYTEIIYLVRKYDLEQKKNNYSNQDCSESNSTIEQNFKLTLGPIGKTPKATGSVSSSFRIEGIGSKRLISLPASIALCGW